MANPFARTLRSLSADRSGRTLLFLLGLLVLLAAWLAWFLLAELPVFVISETARLEAQRAVHPISAQVSGRLSRVAVAVGQEVSAGDVLFELEAEIEERRLEEERARLAALARQLASRRSERASEEAGLASVGRAGALALREAEERRKAAESSALLAAEEVSRKERLHAQGLLPDLDLSRLRAEVERSRAEAAEAALAFRRLEQEQAGEESDRRARIRDIEAEMALLQGDAAAQQAVVRRLEEESRWRLVRAPVVGRVGELARLDAGAVVQAGERLGTIIPGARLKVVGGFPAASALGRVRTGQRAEVRLDGFPWTEYGSLPARVSRVSGELRDGHVWADLELETAPGSTIPLQHGMPGLVSVETERLSPAALLLRAVGKAISR